MVHDNHFKGQKGKSNFSEIADGRVPRAIQLDMKCLSKYKVSSVQKGKERELYSYLFSFRDAKKRLFGA